MNLINDLAYIMIVAGVVTILFKRLKQPLVLGYIVAGFLAGPHMPYTPTVADMPTIETWSELGVIFLMFALGLEFSFKKIIKMGAAPVITAITIVFCMICMGSAVGKLFGWSSMNRLFLGGMMAMSSTTIIYKAFDDMGLRQKKFAKGVMSVLILEDILGIVLMVMLSAMAVSKQFEGKAFMGSLLQLAFFLLLWFIVGIFVIPLFLKKNSRFINKETLLIVSVGLCFLMVRLATTAGYSAAFGAFMMGSILAETVEAEQIEHVTRSIKDLFGAIFFVSVGMLVDPAVLVQYWFPILVIVVSILIGQSLFGTLSFILGGQNLKGGIRSGFSMAQIGEFAFILAGLGNELHVTESFLYPVVVAVSIITTFLTPYMIKAADPVYNTLEYILPRSMQNFINKSSRPSTHGREGQGNMKDVPLSWIVGSNPGYSFIDKQSMMKEMGRVSVWRSLLKQLFYQTTAYFVLVVATLIINASVTLPLCRSLFTHWPGNAICGVFTLLNISLYLRPIVMRKNHSEEMKYLAHQGLLHSFSIFILFLLRYLLATGCVYAVLDYLSPYRWYWHILLSLVIVYFFIKNKRIKLISIRMERTFRHNLTRRDRLEAASDSTAYAKRLRGRDIHIVQLQLPDNSDWGGKRLMDLRFGSSENVIIVAIVRGTQRINIPDGHAMLFPRDIIEVVGDDISIDAFEKRMKAECITNTSSTHQLHIYRMVLTAESSFINKSVAESNLRQQLNSIIIGIEEEDGTLSIVSSDHILRQGDILWLVG